MIEKKLQNVLNALERHYPYESESGIIKLSLGDFAEAIQTLNSIILKNQCARSHPHEDMNELCELKTEIARLNNKLHVRKGNVWSQVYSAMPCYPVEETK